MLRSKQSDKPTQETLVKQFFSMKSKNYMKYYDRNLKSNLTYFCLARKNRILKMIEGNQGKILDVGCGPAVMTTDLLNKGFEVWGIDISEEVIEEAYKKIEKVELSSFVHYNVGNIESLDFPDEFFDIVICSGVLSYLEDATQATKEIYRVLKPGGIAIITVINRGKVNICIRSILMITLRPFITKNGTLFGTKILTKQFKHRKYKPRQLDKLVSKTKFKIIDFAHHHFVFFPFNVLFLNKSLCLAEKMEERFFKSKIWGWLGKGYIIKAKKPDRV